MKRTIKRPDGTLVIDPLMSEDIGKYTCEVSNGIGTPQSASAYLNVECMCDFGRIFELKWTLDS